MIPSPKTMSIQEQDQEDIQVLVNLYQFHSNWDEDAADLVRYAIDTKNAMTKAEVGIEDLERLLSAYQEGAGGDPDGDELLDAVISTLAVAQRRRKQIGDILCIIDCYAENSADFPDHHDLVESTTGTLDAIPAGTKIEEVADLICAYESSSSFGEDLAGLSDITMRTLRSAQETGRSLGSVIDTILNARNSLESQYANDYEKAKLDLPRRHHGLGLKVRLLFAYCRHMSHPRELSLENLYKAVFPEP
jgi:hypothetical protein